MKKTTMWSALALLAIVAIASRLISGLDTRAIGSRYIPVRTPHDITDITTNIIATIGKDFLPGLNVSEANIKQARCYYWESEDLLKFYFIIPYPSEILPVSNSVNGDPQRLNFYTLNLWFPECPKTVLKRIEKAPSGFEWNERVESANDIQVERRTYVIQDGSDLIIVGLNWRRNAPSSEADL